MRYIILMVLILLMISCDSFEKAELSKCLSSLASVESNSYKMYENYVSGVFLDERTEHYIKFYYRTHFVCGGYDYGYEIDPDSSDETVLELYITKKRTGPVSACVCFKEMTVKYRDSSADLRKIKTIKVVRDGYDDMLFEFDEDGDDEEPQEDADTVSDEDAFVPECAKLSEEECAVTSGCETITGRPFNNEKQCWEQYATVGCMVAGPCNSAITYGYSPAGNCYWFNNMCIPDGWNYAQENDEQCGNSLFDKDKCF